ncbi:MAG TPA: CHAT domain-containing protein [Blastocatellia bacterium]|nr:CHAT domain-containing protein [Blastocatellia bacterium]
MPPELPALYDLRVTIDGPAANRYKVHCRLFYHRAYPPAPRREQHRIVFDDEFEEIAATETTVPARRLHYGLFLDKPSQIDPVVIGPGQQLRLDQATRLLFQDEAMKVLRTLFERVMPLGGDPGAKPAPLGRIILEVENPELRRARWEMLGLMEGPDWIEFGHHFLILRRHPSRAGEQSGSFDLPVNIALKSYVNDLSGQGWADSLFDSFTLDARNAGGIVWGELGEETKPGEVHHLIFDSDDRFSMERLTSDVESITPAKEVGRRDDTRMVTPRLLVLHNISQGRTTPDLQPLVDLALDRGADSVILATLPSIDLAAGDFFPAFYRKLMHNWPLDQCVLAARLAAQAHEFSASATFSARDGGELSLLLSRAIIEPVGGKPKARRVRSAEEIDSRTRTRGGRPTRSRPPIRTRGAVEIEREVIDHSTARARSISFDAELRGVGEAVRARAAARGAERIVEEAAPEDTVRLTNLWLTTYDKQKQRPVERDESLKVGEEYDLHIQIGQRRVEALVAEAFPDEKLKEIFKTEDRVTLDVMLFAPDEDFKIESRRAQIGLPRFGNSDELAVPVVPLLAGSRRIRACLYYQNTMLQSIVLETTVVEPGDKPKRGDDTPKTSAVIDYIALTDLKAQSNLPSPVLNLFTNEAPDGTHWIGIFSSGDTGGINLRSGNMHTFSSGRLSTVAKKMRDRLLQVEGDDNAGFRYSSPVPDEDETAQREKDLCSIAVEGWELFHSLFQGTEQPLELNRLKTFKEELTKQGSIVSVSRCRSEGITIPWAALYTLPLDTDRADKISLCGLFKDQLASNLWSDDGLKLEEKKDLLDDPVTCRAQTGCPLGKDKAVRRKTVCPFGFWGFLHQIEQPLQQVTPTPTGQTPPEMQNPKIQTSFLSHGSNDDLKVVCGVYSDLPGAQDHRDEIKKLGITSLKVDDTEDRDRVLERLEEGGWHVYYFYCHGEMENSRFRLKLGFEDDPHYLGASDLDLTEIDWPDHPMPLVFINGCETMAVLPEQIHDFLSVLKQLGASGVIGTEVKVWTDLARPFGSQVLNHILTGKSVGETFLEIRKDMLRHYNPLGLLYNYYSPANLHLHNPESCNWCAAHKPAAAGQQD